MEQHGIFGLYRIMLTYCLYDVLVGTYSDCPVCVFADFVGKGDGGQQDRLQRRHNQIAAHCSQHSVEGCVAALIIR